MHLLEKSDFIKILNILGKYGFYTDKNLVSHEEDGWISITMGESPNVFIVDPKTKKRLFAH